MRIDFYLLTDAEPKASWLLACRLLEKAYAQKHTVFVNCSNEQDALMLDELLWTYKEDSFIPHHLQGEGPTPPPPVQIGFGVEPRGFNDVLLNLSNTIPSFFQKFKRILEIVGADEASKVQSREHYKVYRQFGSTPHIHHLAALENQVS